MVRWQENGRYEWHEKYGGMDRGERQRWLVVDKMMVLKISFSYW